MAIVQKITTLVLPLQRSSAFLISPMMGVGKLSKEAVKADSVKLIIAVAL